MTADKHGEGDIQQKLSNMRAHAIRRSFLGISTDEYKYNMDGLMSYRDIRRTILQLCFWWVGGARPTNFSAPITTNDDFADRKSTVH